MRKLLLGELNAVITGGPDGDGSGDGPLVVLLHGFGAPGTDLVGLARELGVDRSVRFVFPMAPLAMEPGPADLVGRAWWMIDIAALQRAVWAQRYEEFFAEEPLGLDDARRALESLLDAVQERLAPAAPLFLGGFSQGAMLATDTVLRSSRPFAGLVILSGAFICKAEWTRLAPNRAGVPVFQSHGNADPILPYPVAEALRNALREAGLHVQWSPFAGGHGIAPSVLDDLGTYLRQHGGRA